MKVATAIHYKEKGAIMPVTAGRSVQNAIIQDAPNFVKIQAFVTGILRNIFVPVKGPPHFRIGVIDA